MTFHQYLSLDWILSGFPPQSPVIGLGGFSPATWSFETHQLPYRARMFSLDLRFSSPVSRHWVGRFFTKLHSYLHVWRNSRPRGKVIIMSWSRDLQITCSTWSSHVSLIITRPARDLPTSSFHPKILHASTSSSSPLLWALLRIV